MNVCQKVLSSCVGLICISGRQKMCYLIANGLRGSMPFIVMFLNLLECSTFCFNNSNTLPTKILGRVLKVVCLARSVLVVGDLAEFYFLSKRCTQVRIMQWNLATSQCFRYENILRRSSIFKCELYSVY